MSSNAALLLTAEGQVQTSTAPGHTDLQGSRGRCEHAVYCQRVARTESINLLHNFIEIVQ